MSATDRIVYTHFKLCGKKSFDDLARATVGFLFDKNTSTLYYSVAWCSPKDRFIKKEGRNIVEERINNNIEMGIGLNNYVYNKRLSYYEICRALLTIEMSSNGAPNWAKKYNFVVNDMSKFSYDDGEIF